MKKVVLEQVSSDRKGVFFWSDLSLTSVLLKLFLCQCKTFLGWSYLGLSVLTDRVFLRFLSLSLRRPFTFFFLLVANFNVWSLYATALLVSWGRIGPSLSSPYLSWRSLVAPWGFWGTALPLKVWLEVLLRGGSLSSAVCTFSSRSCNHKRRFNSCIERLLSCISWAWLTDLRLQHSKRSQSLNVTSSSYSLYWNPPDILYICNSVSCLRVLIAVKPGDLSTVGGSINKFPKILESELEWVATEKLMYLCI